MTDVADARIWPFIVRRLARAGQRQGCGRHVAFALPVLAREALDGMAVMVARGEIHVRIDACRVAPQRLLDHARGLDKGVPVDAFDRAQAGQAVGERGRIQRLRLAVARGQCVEGEAVVGQAGADPFQHLGQGGAPPLQALRQFGDEGRLHRLDRARHVGHLQDQVAGTLLGGIDHARGPFAGQLALLPGVDQARGQAAQVLDQGQAQHDRKCPQLAEGEHGALLVGADEMRQACFLDQAVALGDEFEAQVVNARLPRCSQARQRAAVGARQVMARGADLLVDQVVVVEQRFGGRQGGIGAALGRTAARQGGAGGGDGGGVVGQARQQRFGCLLLRQDMAPGERAGVQRHPRGIEALGA